MSTPAHTPPLPAGEVRLLPDGTRAICTGAPYWRWKLVNVHNDPDGGWRTDRDAAGWERLGNVYELVVAATAVRDEPSSEDTPARECTGANDCAAVWHVHGCHADHCASNGGVGCDNPPFEVPAGGEPA